MSKLRGNTARLILGSELRVLTVRLPEEEVFGLLLCHCQDGEADIFIMFNFLGVFGIEKAASLFRGLRLLVGSNQENNICGLLALRSAVLTIEDKGGRTCTLCKTKKVMAWVFFCRGVRV